MTVGAQDGYLIVEDGAATNEIALCSSAENKYVSGAAGDIYGEYDHTFSGSGDGAVLEGHNIVTTMTSSTSSSLVNVVALSRFRAALLVLSGLTCCLRGQLYDLRDNMLNSVCIGTLFGLALMLALILTHTKNKKDNDASATAEIDIDKMVSDAKPHLYLLEEHLRNALTEDVICQNFQTSESGEGNYLDKREAVLSKQMRAHAIGFWIDGQAGYDATTRLKVMLLPSRLSTVLTGLWPFFHAGPSTMITNCSIVTGILLEIAVDSTGSTGSSDNTGAYVVQCLVVLWIGIDALMHSMYSFVASRSILTCGVATSYSFGPDEMFAGVMLPVIWMSLVLSCFSSHTYSDQHWLCQIKHYLFPVLLLCRNRTLWLSLVALGCSAASAAHVLLLFLCILVFYSTISMLLLQDLYQTGDFYTDNQYANFFSAFTTMFIYLANGNSY